MKQFSLISGVVLLIGFLVITSRFFPSARLVSISCESPLTKLVPQEAIFFYLNHTNPSEEYTLTDFVPDQSFTGYYNIRIDCLLWLEYHDPPCNISCINKWNASDVSYFKSTDDPWHSTYSYTFSQPTAGDPIFAIFLICSSPESLISAIEGWIVLQITDQGTNQRPPHFIMPTSASSCQIHPTNSSNSSLTQPVPLLGVVSIFTLVFLVSYKKRFNYK